MDNNDGWLLAADGTESALEHGSKTLMASRIVDAIAAFLAGGSCRDSSEVLTTVGPRGTAGSPNAGDILRLTNFLIRLEPEGTRT